MSECFAKSSCSRASAVPMWLGQAWGTRWALALAHLITCWGISLLPPPQSTQHKAPTRQLLHRVTDPLLWSLSASCDQDAKEKWQCSAVDSQFPSAAARTRRWRLLCSYPPLQTCPCKYWLDSITDNMPIANPCLYHLPLVLPHRIYLLF